MTVRRLVRIVYLKRKKYYLITPCVTINEVDYGYSLPITKIDADLSYEVLFDAIAGVMPTILSFMRASSTSTSPKTSW